MRRLLSVLLIALLTASALMLPASGGLDEGAQAAASDCSCDDTDCAKNAPCGDALCVSACANWIAAYLPVIERMSLAREAASAAAPDIGRAALDRPPPLPPPIA